MAWKEKSVVNQAINLGLVDSAIKTTVHVSQRISLNKLRKYYLCCSTFLNGVSYAEMRIHQHRGL